MKKILFLTAFAFLSLTTEAQDGPFAFYGKTRIFTGNGLHWNVDQDASTNLIWRTWSGRYFDINGTVFKQDGSVGIGTTSPSEKLEVNGNAIFQGNIESMKVKVTQTPGNWPDYVFSPNFKLRTLNELEQFIQKNQHLPEVPSAKEVEANGLDLGDMEAILLKKVEELTLYMIEQNKRLEKLEVENKELKKKLRD